MRRRVPGRITPPTAMEGLRQPAVTWGDHTNQQPTSLRGMGSAYTCARTSPSPPGSGEHGSGAMLSLLISCGVGCPGRITPPAAMEGLRQPAVTWGDHTNQQPTSILYVLSHTRGGHITRNTTGCSPPVKGAGAMWVIVGTSPLRCNDVQCTVRHPGSSWRERASSSPQVTSNLADYIASDVYAI